LQYSTAVKNSAAPHGAAQYAAVYTGESMQKTNFYNSITDLYSMWLKLKILKKTSKADDWSL
jgi:hypothetical protein